MVENNKYINVLLHHPYQFSEEEMLELEEIIKQYPYFQAAKSMQVKYLKEHELFSKTALLETAALTTDRNILYLYIEDNKLLFKSKKNNDKTTLIAEKTTTEEKIEKNIEKTDLGIEKIVKIAEQETKKVVSKQKTSDKMSYLEWLEQLSRPKKQKNNEFFDAIDNFLKNKPKIVPVKHKSFKAPAIIDKSVEEKQMLMTETLANLYVKQKKYDKAIQAFKILSLKYPKKSSYFANRISEIKQK